MKLLSKLFITVTLLLPYFSAFADESIVQGAFSIEGDMIDYDKLVSFAADKNVDLTVAEYCERNKEGNEYHAKGSDYFLQPGHSTGKKGCFNVTVRHLRHGVYALQRKNSSVDLVLDNQQAVTNFVSALRKTSDDSYKKTFQVTVVGTPNVISIGYKVPDTSSPSGIKINHYFIPNPWKWIPWDSECNESFCSTDALKDYE